MFKKIAVLGEMVKFKLTVFAMPFAFMGAFLAGHGAPSWGIIFWVILAMVGARTCAMGFSIADRHFDHANPRTASRAIPAGEVSLVEAWAMVILAGLLFFFACYNLNALTVKLAPLALALTLFYSLTKRFTSLCHLVLGVALAFSPLGGWVAVSGSLTGFPWVLSSTLSTPAWMRILTGGPDCIRYLRGWGGKMPFGWRRVSMGWPLSFLP